MAGAVLRPLSMGEILDVSFGMYRAQFVPLLLVSVATRIVPIIISVYLQSAGNRLVYLNFLIFGLTVVLGAVAVGASTFIISERYLGKTLPASEAFRRASPFVLPLIVVGVLTWLVTVVAAVIIAVPVGILAALGAVAGRSAALVMVPAGIIAAIVLAGFVVTGLALASPALIIERLPGAIAAMGRSWNLTKGHRLKIFGALLITFILLFLPVVALSGYAIASGFNPATMSMEPSATVIMTVVIASLLQVLIYPLLYCVVTIAYYDLRVRKEAFDLEVLAAGLSRA
ncbi:MAG: hypothetical protein U0133_05620 [Gemmatimonadales bacterium]